VRGEERVRLDRFNAIPILRVSSESLERIDNLSIPFSRQYLDGF